MTDTLIVAIVVAAIAAVPPTIVAMRTHKAVRDISKMKAEESQAEKGKNGS